MASRKSFAELKQRFPADIDYAITLDTTLPVTAGIKEILKTLFEAMVLVIIVVYIFCRIGERLSSRWLPYPCRCRHLCVFSFDGFLDQHAFALCLCSRHRSRSGRRNCRRGGGRTSHRGREVAADATYQAMKEVSGPVIGIALILAAVFLPVGFMSGIQGRLSNQFAVTIAISVLISAFNALTLSPALAALLLRPRKESKGVLDRFFGSFNRA